MPEKPTAKAKRPRKPRVPRGRVFTVPHFQAWALKLELDNGAPWVVEDYFLRYVEDVFAAMAARTLMRLWLVVPEGNAKTTGLAGLALYHCEFLQHAFVPWAAASRDQAEIGYGQAKLFASSMPPSRRPRCYDGYRRIKFPNGSRIQIFAADPGTGDGPIPTLPIIDELHRQKNMGLYRTWAGKLRKRQAQMLVISTAGEPGSEFEDTREKIKADAEDVRLDGAFGRYATPRVILHEYAVRDGAIDDMAAVKSANPASWIDEKYLEEKRSDPDMTDSHWKRFTCNIATAIDSDPFVLEGVWAGLADGDEIPLGSSVTLGADGSRSWDTTVIAWAHEADDGRIDVDARVFGTVEDRPHHVLHSGGKIDFDDVESFLLDLFDRFHPLETAYDPRYLERSMEIVDRRLPSLAIHPVEPFSKNMRDALQVFYTAVADGRVRHQGDPVIAAHLANTKVERDQRNQEIRRIGKIDQRKNIDAVPALALAVWRVGFAQRSVYETRGVLTA